ncbi:MAG: hypothetical protein ACT4NX_03805 [Deltaproteobacteria bacterium]
MKLEDLLQDEEATKEEKALQRAVEIAGREWENIRKSLSLLGDIGNFSESDFMIGVIARDVIARKPLLSPTKSVSGYSPTFYPMYLVTNLITMDENLDARGYKTTHALFVFIELATKASERLGLVGTFSMGFGSGYAHSRTGWIAEKGNPLERDIFARMFFKGAKVDYNWGFHWNSTGERLKLIFEKFMSWQKDESLYQSEVKSKAVVKPMMI